MSIPTNIVEGRRKKSEKEFARFLEIALNSGFELEYQLIVGQDIGVISDEDYALLLRGVIEVRKMIYGLLRKLDDRAHEQDDFLPPSALSEAPS